MKYGVVFPGGDARTAAETARAAEQAGWDGFFVWEPVWGYDAWVSLAAAAMITERIRLGTMITPLSRMRPWKLASETVTLDHLSGGRVILSVGLGALDSGFAAFGEVTDRKTRAELLDEGLEILAGLWQGKPIHFQGKHYQITETNFMIPPPTVQQPRIPVWVVAAWPRPRSLARALRWDGLLPNVMRPGEPTGRPTVEEFRAIADYAAEHRTAPGPFDLVAEGETPGEGADRGASLVRPWQEAGATWWLEARWEGGVDALRQRLEQGPPRLE